MKLVLAPMEGLIDAPMRDLLGRIGGYDYAVCEFIRVTEQRLPRRTLLRLCPELASNGHTASGLAVIPQLLGSHPASMARTARQLAELGAAGIDLNFGCPSKTVNRKDGGAILLREPERIHAIVAAVRQAVPADIPVSAKIRLGYEDTALALDNAHAVVQGGAQGLTVHARTKVDGYHAPARWEWLARIRQAVDLPIIANGDIRSVADYWRCREISGCEDIMIGRAAVGCPDLARQIRQSQQGGEQGVMAWPVLAMLVVQMGDELKSAMLERHLASRLKQWLVLLRQFYPEAQQCFERCRPLRLYGEMRPYLIQGSSEQLHPGLIRTGKGNS
ncbi:MAG: tRNA dihydrouridine synthase [Thiohalomonadaceae bacterium]